MSVRTNAVMAGASALAIVSCNHVAAQAPLATSMAADDQYAACKDQEKLGDASTCWKKWLADNGNTGESPQKDYAKMYVAQHAGGGANGAGMANTQGAVKVIPVLPEAEQRGRSSRREAASQWPERTVGDRECWEHMDLTGRYADDYNALVERCGKPTGMLPFSKPLEGELGPDHEADVYTIKLLGGGCYRFFAVADATLKNLDVAIATMEGKVLWVDKNTQAVAIVEWDKAICVEADAQFKFLIGAEGGGSGGYGFGIWVRPAE